MRNMLRVGLVVASMFLLSGCASLWPWSSGQSFKDPEVTSFLEAGFSHTFFSSNRDDNFRNSMINILKNQKCNAIYFYAANDKDYGNFPVRYDSSKKGMWRGWIEKMRDAGLKPVLWLRADDSSTLNTWSLAQWQAYIDQIVKDLDDLVEVYVVGLELDEYWGNGSMVNALGSYLNGKTNKPIGVHQLQGRCNFAQFAWCDVMYYQYGFGKSASQIKNETIVKKSVVGKRFIACEYAIPSSSASAKALGDSALSGGADGVGNNANR